MPTFRKRGKTWRAEVERRGVRRSATFDSKAAAVAWAGRIEAEIMAGHRGEIPNLTLDAVLERYARDVSPAKKGARWEKVRITLLRRDRIAQVALRRFAEPHVADWRERRLQSVSAASVRREWNLLSHACQLAVTEWHWLKENPFRKVKRPVGNQPRTRVATDDEIERILAVSSESMRRVIVFALETGMRAGEIVSLRAKDVQGRVATLRDTKNGTSRQVPLSEKAIAQGAEFNLTSGSVSRLFSLSCQAAGVQGLTFHDLRRTAITRLAKILDPMTLAKMVGHRDLRMTLNVYFQADMQDVAAKLG